MLRPGDQDEAYNPGSRKGDISDERPIDPIVSLGGDLGTHSIPNFMFCPSPPVPAIPARACHSFGLSGAIYLPAGLSKEGKSWGINHCPILRSQGGESSC